MQLSELVDLEWQLAEDDLAQEAGRGHEILERDRSLGPRVVGDLGVTVETARLALEKDPAFRSQVCKAYVARLRRAGLEFYGERMESGYRVVGLFLAILGFLLGIGTARAVLHYDGKEPINVFNFLAVFVLLQLLLLALMVLLFTGRRLFFRDISVGWFQALIVRLARTRFVDRLLSGRSKLPLADAFTRLRARNHLFKDVERWMLFALAQRFGVAFNLGALGATVLLITFTDLAFGWSTTLDLGPEAVHDVCRKIAVPWAPWHQSGVPAEDLVAKTQWSRLRGGGFTSGLLPEQAAALARSWWPFLVMGLVVYGLAPRMIALAMGLIQSGRALRRVPLDHFRCQRLYERLLPPLVERSAPAVALEPPSALPTRQDHAPTSVTPSNSERRAEESVLELPRQLEVPERVRRAAKPKAEIASAPSKLALVLWGALAAEARRLQGLLFSQGGEAQVVEAGQADPARDTQGLASLQKQKPTAVHFAVEAGVQPTREILGYLRELRRAMGPRAQLFVSILGRSASGFVDAEPDELQIWRRRLDGEGDPYLGLRRLGDAT